MLNVIYVFFLIAMILISAGCTQIRKKNIFDDDFQAERSLQKFKGNRDVKTYLKKYQKTFNDVRYDSIGRKEEFEEVVVLGSVVKQSENITNNQEANVDEGGIVKAFQHYLVILRQGRLYSVDIGKGENAIIKKVHQIDVSPPENKHEAWYDEILIHQNIIVVVGFSYELEATELVFFTVSDAGQFTYQKTYLVKTTDYYDESNYAGRLIDGNLILYLEDYVPEDITNRSMTDMLSPRVSLLDRNGNLVKGYPLLKQHEIFKPLQFNQELARFTLLVCPLNLDEFSCTAKSIFSGYAAAHYVSSDAMYIWTWAEGWGIDLDQYSSNRLRRLVKSSKEPVYNDGISILYRLPLNEPGVGAVELLGEPINQFSFMQQEQNMYVFGRVPSGNPKWFDVDYDQGKSYWAKIPVELFDRSISSVSENDYRWISEDQEGDKYNRFINDQLVFISNQDSSEEELYRSNMVISKLNGVGSPINLTMDYEVHQIEPLNDNALLMGNDKNSTIFSSLDLNSSYSVIDKISKKDASLAETRSHGFNYRQFGGRSIFSTPVYINLVEDPYKKVDGQYFEAEPTSDMLYYSVDEQQMLGELGSLNGDREIRWGPDDCEVSCMDWYGSSRPIFIQGRIFALLKNELIEGYLSSNTIFEKYRVNITK